jgi:tryptophan 2,3-dioxygenase
MSKKTKWDQYHEYEDLDRLLNAQSTRSDAAGHPVHDEMLFIIFHQVYELWFKQILFEMDEIQTRLNTDIVDEREMQPILTYLGRIEKIFTNMVSMMDILETMPPQSFIDFREHLGTASGFQSWQFRLVEMRLGLRREDRIPVFGGEFDDQLRAESQKQFKTAETSPSLFEQVDSWLSRTPFVDWKEYKFHNAYMDAVHEMFDRKMVFAQSKPDEIARGKEKFDSIFNAEKYKSTHESGAWRLSQKALQAALFITIYREEPVLQAPYRLLQHLIDVDCLMTRWRYRHALIVQRMVGMGAGTGGSSGYHYLMETLDKHRIFSDFFSLASYVIPSSERPALPEDLRRKLGFQY